MTNNNFSDFLKIGHLRKIDEVAAAVFFAIRGAKVRNNYF
jgi:hypothetical protein